MCRNKKRRAKYKRTLGILAGLVIGLILIALICAREADRPKPETDCVKCPIKDICLNEPYLWEV